MPGLIVFSSGAAWEKAFSEALLFLEQGQGTVLLGPAINSSAEAWLKTRFVPENGVRLGARVLKWTEWVKGKARDRALSLGKGFRPLNGASERERLRIVAQSLTDTGGFYHLHKIWKEERFFSALLKCVLEARMAGLVEKSQWERARDLLGEGPDPLTREAYQDFWTLLEAYEHSLCFQEPERLDQASLLRLAADSDFTDGPFYLLGFEGLALLEVDLLQRMALNSDVLIPLPLDHALMESLIREKPGSIDLAAALALRGLATNFSGSLKLRGEASERQPSRSRFLAAHSPYFEAQAAGALARAAGDRFNEIRLILPDSYFGEGGTAAAFQEELGLPPHFEIRSAADHPISQVFLHALEIKEKDFSLFYGLELAQLLSFTQADFAEVPSLAARFGIRKGLEDWRKKGSHPVLQRFVSVLEEIDKTIPHEGDAARYAGALERITELVGITELARRSPDHQVEREAHTALSSILRNAQMLKASIKQPLSFQEWLVELKTSLSAKPFPSEVFFPQIQIYGFRDWLPPAHEKTLTLLLGLEAGNEPRRSFDFFLEDAARRKLSEFLLPTRVQEDLSFLDRLRRASSVGKTIFSRSRHDSLGKEKEPSWTAGPLGLVPGSWPEVAPIREEKTWLPKEQVFIPGLEVSRFSASLLEVYKECPFKAFAERILRIEDKVQESSLDMSRLDEGSLIHKVLEIFYRDENGKELGSREERERALERSFQQALQDPAFRIEYFRGNESLLEAQLARARRTLADFIEADIANYEKFPFFGKPETEKKVGGKISGFDWEGKIDRVDLDPEAKKLLVLDYKIGTSTPKSVEVKHLKKFQLQLYMDAAEAAFPGFEAAGALYASVASGERGQGAVRKDFNAGSRGLKPGERKYFGFGASSGALYSEEDFQDLRRRTREEVEGLASKIVEGDFSVTPLEEEESCSRCSIRPACRIREIRAPSREPFPRISPETLLDFLAEPLLEESQASESKGFNPEQKDALSRRDQLVFIEASAGTGKTTVIAERIRLFLHERDPGEPLYRRVEKFAAISFTEKSAQELAARAAKLLLQDPLLGPQVAAQAQQQVSTIHGFCRKIINDFPVEAGISPLSATLDQKSADALIAELVDEFFLFPGEETRALQSALFQEFSRAKLEEMLLRLLAERHLIQADVLALRSGAFGERIFSEGVARDVLLQLLDLAERFAAKYEEQKRIRNVLDFNDLEMMALKILGHPHAREFYQKQFDLLLVDEFQDTNVIQRSILDALARPESKNLFVVGDAKQSIYRFRAADVAVFQKMRQEANASGNLVTLSRNYRSAREIVDAANCITRAIFPASGETAPDFEAVDSQAIPEREPGGRVELVEYGSEEDPLRVQDSRAIEARLMALKVQEIRSRPGRPHSVAVLLRKIAGNEVYLRALTDAGIPFRVGSSRGFFGQTVITDAIALLRVLYGANNDIALLSVLRSPWCHLSDSAILEIHRRGEALDALWDKLSPEDAPKIFHWKKISSHSSLSWILDLAFRDYPLGRRELLQLRKLQTIVVAMERESKTRAEILERLSAWAGWDKETDGQDDAPMPEPGGEGTVQVMTVHAAKGLEFDVTLLADLTGRLKGDNSALRIVRGAGMVLKLESEERSEAYTKIGKKGTERELAELKRLFYVAVTRAKREEVIFLPRSHSFVDPGKWANCGHFLRAANFEGGVARISGESLLDSRRSDTPAVEGSLQFLWPSFSERAFFSGSSVTKLAAYEFCPEFHRRKVVQGWDDQVVAFWPRSHSSRMPAREQGKSEEEKKIAIELLRALRVESKERGIALHRVLERVRDGSFPAEQALIWLSEAYEAQGADIESPEFQKLAELDLDLLQRFLSSPLGIELFSPGIEAYPELPFQWNLRGLHLQGSIDRAIRRKDGSWIVVDYKSSVLEESLAEYRFQVKAYMAAVMAHAREKFGVAPKMEGFLVDLYACKSMSVSTDPVEALLEVEQNLEKVRQSYTQASNRDYFLRSGLRGGKHCFKCTYRIHCEIGKELG